MDLIAFLMIDDLIWADARLNNGVYRYDQYKLDSNLIPSDLSLNDSKRIKNECYNLICNQSSSIFFDQFVAINGESIRIPDYLRS